MGNADEQSYEEVIARLGSFISDVDGECQVMERAGQDCLDNMDEDPNTARGCEKLSSCVQSVRANYVIVEAVIKALQQELEDIRRTNSISFD